jgi:ABC-type multidrug transport system fused ATPase/permease subunit
MSLFGSLASVANLLITRYVVNQLQASTEEDIFPIVLTMVLALFVFNVMYSFINSYIQHKIIPVNNQIINQKMQTELYSHAAIVQASYYDNPVYFNQLSMALQQSDARAHGVLSVKCLAANLRT